MTNYARAAVYSVEDNDTGTLALLDAQYMHTLALVASNEYRAEAERAGDTLTLHTSSNVMFAYACENPEYRNEWHVYELTRAGRIRYARTIANYLATSDCKDADARALHNEGIAPGYRGNHDLGVAYSVGVCE